MHCFSHESLVTAIQTNSPLTEERLTHLDQCRACRRLIAFLVTSVGATHSQCKPADEPLVPLLQPGAMCGRYLVLDRIGIGGMGTVYSAYDNHLARNVALKLVRASHANSNEAHQALLREAQAMAKLNHPNVCAVYDTGSAFEQMYLVMELVEGTTLRQWLSPTRSWREVARVFVDAGRGLSAAHHAGLIHRDFKPDNVLVGTDGRVRVSDFGLAHAAETNITEAGVGTWAFMSPEQRKGEAATALSDQFSYCVAFESALPPKMPRWLGQIIARGLEIEPEKRFSSLDELVNTLERGLTRRRTALGIGAGLALSVFAVSLALAGIERGTRCRGMENQLHGVWDDSVRKAGQSAFEATERTYAKHVWNKVRQNLDDYAERWVLARKNACEAAKVRHDHSAELHDAQVICLDRKLGQLGALANVFTRADATMVDGAIEASLKQSHDSLCDDLEALSAEPRPPVDSQDYQAAISALAEGNALSNAGQFHQALPKADSALAHALRSEHAPTVTAATYLKSELLAQMGEYAKAEESALETIWTADRARVGVLRAEAWLELMVMQTQQGKITEALKAGNHAQAVLTTLAKPPSDLASRIERGFGGAYLVGDKAEQALERFERARALATDEVASAKANAGIGRTLDHLGRYAEALPVLERALVQVQEREGKEHPEVATTINSMATTLKNMGRFDESLNAYREALRIRIALFGTNHRAVASTHNSIGTLYKKMGRIDEAHAEFLHSIHIDESLDGTEHVRLAFPLSNLGNIALDLGNLKEAVALQRRALALMLKSTLGSGPAAGVHINLSNALLAEGNVQEAINEAKAGIAALPSSEHPLYTEALLAHIEALTAHRELTQASDGLRRLRALIPKREASLEFKARVDLADAHLLAYQHHTQAKPLALKARTELAENKSSPYHLRRADALINQMKWKP